MPAGGIFDGYYIFSFGFLLCCKLVLIVYLVQLIINVILLYIHVGNYRLI